jgi:hypothetical protein
MLDPLNETKWQRSIGMTAVLNLAILALLSGRPSFSNASRPVRGISSPILAMEMVQNVAEVDTVLSDAPSPDREVMRLKQYVDFGYILAYAALFVLMSIFLMRQGRAIAISAAVLGTIAGIFDVIENLGILRILDVDISHTTQAMIDAIRYPSLIKWALLSITLGLLGILALRTGRTGLRIVGALDVLAGLLGLYGVLHNHVGLQGLVYVGSIALVALAILYFRPRLPKPRRSA